MSKVTTFDYQYENTDWKSVYDFGTFLKHTGGYMKESDKKWEFVCRIDCIQNTEHASINEFVRLLEACASDLRFYLNERPYDNHFIVDKKNDTQNASI